MISTPSCLSRSRKARFPDMMGKKDLQVFSLSPQAGRGWAGLAGEQVSAAAVGWIMGGDALGPEPRAEVETRRPQVAIRQPQVRNARERLLERRDRDQGAVGDTRMGARRWLDAVADPALERDHQRAHGAVVVERVDAV